MGRPAKFFSKHDPMALPPGTRVVLSQDGLDQFPKYKGRRGRIVRGPKHARVIVKWNGLKSKQYWHMTLVDPINKSRVRNSHKQ